MALTALLAISVAVSSSPAGIVLGKDSSARLHVKVTGFLGRAVADANVSLSTNLGTVGNVQSTGRGEFAVTYRPPRQRAPAVALIAAEVEADGEHAVGWLALPLSGSDSMTLQTRPRAKVELTIDGVTFGPVTADARGDATVAVVVPPGVAHATMRVVDPLGNVLERPLDLDPPPFARIRAVPVGPPLAAPDGPLDIEVFAIGPDGSPDRSARIKATADRGTIDGPRRRADVAVLRYRPPSDAAGEAHLEIADEELRVQIARSAARPSGRQSLEGFSAGVFGTAAFAPGGAAVGGVLAEVAVPLAGAPFEWFVDVGGNAYGALLEAAPQPYGTQMESATARALVTDLGARWSEPFGPGIALHASLFAGLQFASVNGTVYGPPLQFARSDGGVAPHGGAALGLTFSIGSERLLVQGVGDFAGSAGRMTTSLTSFGMQIGLLHSFSR
jgi:hypothetical protein